jgi:hypothetical protein
MPAKQIGIEQPDSKRINHILLGLDGNGVINHVEISVNVETEIEQVSYLPQTDSLTHTVAEFSATVCDGLDLLPNEAIALFNAKESFSGA